MKLTGWLARIRRPFTSNTPRRRRKPVSRLTSNVEVLEARKLLSAANVEFDAGQGQIEIAGTSNSDAVEVSYLGRDKIQVVSVTSGARQKAVFDRADVRSIYFSGGNGDDVFMNRTGVRSRS